MWKPRPDSNSVLNSQTCGHLTLRGEVNIIIYGLVPCKSFQWGCYLITEVNKAASCRSCCQGLIIYQTQTNIQAVCAAAADPHFSFQRRRKQTSVSWFSVAAVPDSNGEHVHNPLPLQPAHQHDDPWNTAQKTQWRLNTCAHNEERPKMKAEKQTNKPMMPKE